MTRRILSLGTLATLAWIVAAGLPGPTDRVLAHGGNGTAPVITAYNLTATISYSTPPTSWGDPDLQGVAGSTRH